MSQVVVIGCGIIGAAIAYELSQIDGLSVMVLDRQPPAQASTGAALGVLMGAISQKTKGRAWRLRDASIRRYQTLIPELEAQTRHTIPVNHDGIVLIQFDDDDVSKWERIVDLRRSHGWKLHIWDEVKLRDRCPQIGDALGDRTIAGAIYSPDDLQIEPTALTHGLLTAAQHNGATVRFDAEVRGLEAIAMSDGSKTCHAVQVMNSDQVVNPEHPAPMHNPSAVESIPKPDSSQDTASLQSIESIDADWVIVAAGLGSAQLSQTAHPPLDLRPVLGQAMRVRLDSTIGHGGFHPVMSGHDIHIVPLRYHADPNHYWVGATVEFPDDAGCVVADQQQLETVWHRAIALCPALENATILETWSGLRPRPWNQSAPVIEPLAGYTNVILATGHYRNGVLLAPATAQRVAEMIRGN
ncbi:MAG TPA: NAD(P)/FAD-dependent oxidoreductase [Elainellaceae cyanobacterium]|jgi:glycine/D-amino acid oxidase-like deaminating enzyme